MEAVVITGLIASGLVLLTLVCARVGVWLARLYLRRRGPVSTPTPPPQVHARNYVEAHDSND